MNKSQNMKSANEMESLFKESANKPNISLLKKFFHQNQKISISDAKKLIFLAKQLFDSEPNCLTIPVCSTIVGAIQGLHRLIVVLIILF